jgi:hypothetical protein
MARAMTVDEDESFDQRVFERRYWPRRVYRDGHGPHVRLMMTDHAPPRLGSVTKTPTDYRLSDAEAARHRPHQLVADSAEVTAARSSASAARDQYLREVSNAWKQPITALAASEIEAARRQVTHEPSVAAQRGAGGGVQTHWPSSVPHDAEPDETGQDMRRPPGPAGDDPDRDAWVSNQYRTGANSYAQGYPVTPRDEYVAQLTNAWREPLSSASPYQSRLREAVRGIDPGSPDAAYQVEAAVRRTSLSEPDTAQSVKAQQRRNKSSATTPPAKMDAAALADREAAYAEYVDRTINAWRER